MAAFKTYEEIEAWQRGRRLVNAIYDAASVGAFSKDYGLKDQIQRASVSICSNIAEGFERRGNKEFVKFLWIAKGSAAEVSSQLYHAFDRGYIDKTCFDRLYDDAKAISAKVYNLIKSITTSEKGEDFKRL